MSGRSRLGLLIAVACGLAHSADAQTLSQLLAEMGATLERASDGAGSGIVVAIVRVPAATELEAIRRAYADTTVRRAGLDLVRLVGF